jgi:ubiquinone/menaquinone biosynthesis C-methylase UbiE
MKVKQNPFDCPEIAQVYEVWYDTTGKSAARQEKKLLRALIRQSGGVKTVLDVGCGTGYFTAWYRTLGMSAVGLDRSRLMIQQAQQNHAIACILGDAHNLPFSANAFDLVSYITTLEFLGNPGSVIGEGQRVSRKALLLGVINQHSLLGWRYRQKGGPIWDSANFFTLAQLIRMINENISQPHKILYWTTIWPFGAWISKLPWGGFIGMLVILES